ncbi:UbiA prenyltransferase family protein [bacterium]|nr:UbiA prenyltransferase family protein [bacterium]
MKKIKSYIELIRVKQWIKNLLVFVPILCARNFNLDILAKVGIGFVSFSCLASFVYIVNDIKDIQKDKLHPRKRKRPLPSGRVNKKEAIILAFVMLALSTALNYVSRMAFLDVSWIFWMSYLVINLGYSFGLKNYAIVDIALLSAGFVIRIYYGGALADVLVSDWLFLTVLSASLFLALGKRKKEFLVKENVRKVLERYSKDYIDKLIYVFVALTFVFYSLWAMEQDVKYLIYTVPIIVLIFMKYCLIMEKSDEGDPTTIIYQSKGLLGLCAVYGLIMILIYCL